LLYAYIGAAAVVAILIALITVSVLWLAERVTKEIRDKTVDLIAAYDVLFVKRSRELEALEERQRELSSKGQKKEAFAVSLAGTEKNTTTDSVFLNVAERYSTTGYRESAMGWTYRRIKDGFTHTPREVLAQLSVSTVPGKEGPATRLLKELPYDTVYRLSLLSSEEQQEVLRSALPEESKGFLDTYLSTQRQFHVIEFYDYIQAAAQLEPRKPRLWVSPVEKGPFPEGVEVLVDTDICEGFQLEVNNILYDYCIKGRELS